MVQHKAFLFIQPRHRSIDAEALGILLYSRGFLDRILPTLDVYQAEGLLCLHHEQLCKTPGVSLFFPLCFVSAQNISRREARSINSSPFLPAKATANQPHGPR
jgi:hypothetical protein